MVEIFLSEAWLKILEVPQDHKEFMVRLAKGFVELQRSQTDFLEFIHKSEVSPIADAWNQVSRLCKAILVAFAEPVEGVQPSDLFWFAEYKGPNLFERSMKTIVTQSKWWCAQLADVARTASTKPLANGASMKLQALMQDPQIPLTGNELKEVSELFEEVHRSLREMEIKQYSETILAKVKVTAEALQSTNDLSSVSPQAVDSILKLLTMFGHIPGAPSIQEEFSKWASGAQTILRRNKFLSVLQSATATDANFEDVKAMLEECPASTFANVKANPDMLAAVLHFLEKGCRTVAHKAYLLLSALFIEWGGQ